MRYFSAAVQEFCRTNLPTANIFAVPKENSLRFLEPKEVLNAVKELRKGVQWFISNFEWITVAQMCDVRPDMRRAATVLHPMVLK